MAIDPKVEIAFADTPLTVSPTWTDVTARTRRVDIDRDYDPYLRRHQAGRATIVLENLDRDFEPGYALSPHYPNVKRRRQVRVTVPSYALDLPGTAGNYASTPDAAALDITGDIDIRAKVALDDWTPAALQRVVSKRVGEGVPAYSMYVGTAGGLSLNWSADGIAQLTMTSTAATGVADGAAKWIRATLDVNDGAGNRVAKFYTSDDGVTWTQLGTTVTTAGVTSIFAGAAEMRVGGFSDTFHQSLAGLVHYAEVRNGIDGTVVASPDFRYQPTGTTTFLDAQGNRWTINGAGSALVAGTPTARFRGVIDRIVPEYGHNGLDATVTLECIDLFGYLAELELENPYVREVQQDNPLAYWRLNDPGTADGAGNFPLTDYSGNGKGGAFTATGVTYGAPDPITDDDDGAVTLDGVNGWAAAGAVDFGDQGLDVEAWIRTTGTLDHVWTQNLGRRPGLKAHLVTGGAFNLSLIVEQVPALGTAVEAYAELQSSVAINDGAWHHVVFSMPDLNDTGTWKSYVDATARTFVSGSEFGTFTAGWPQDVVVGIGADPGSASARFDGSLAEIALYAPGTMTSSRVNAHYDARNALLNESSGERIVTLCNHAGIPEALTNLDFGSPGGESTLTSAGNLATRKALQAMQDVEVTEAGALYVSSAGLLTFLDRTAPHGGESRSTTSQVTYTGATGSGTKFTGDPSFADSAADVANVIRNTRRNGTTHIAEDAASITTHLERSRALSTISSTTAEAEARTSWELALAADPTGMRVRTLAFLAEPNNAAAVLGRDKWDRVTADWAPPGGGTAISQVALVVGIRDRYQPGEYRVSLALDPTETLPAWRIGIVGASEVGTTTRLFF